MKKVIYQVLDKADKNAKISITYLDETGEIKQQCVYQENFGEYLLEKERAYRYYAKLYLDRIFKTIERETETKCDGDTDLVEEFKYWYELIKDGVLDYIQINQDGIQEMLIDTEETLDYDLNIDYNSILEDPEILKEIELERQKVIKDNNKELSVETLKAIKKFYPEEFNLFNLTGRVPNTISHRTWTNEYTWEEVVEDFEKLKETGDATYFLEKYSSEKQKEQLEEVGIVLDNNENFIQDGEKVEDYLLSLLEYVDGTIEGITKFYKRLEKNVDPYVKAQILNWIKATYNDDYKKIKITSEGNLIAFKGVDEKSGVYYSIHTGTAIADGVRYDKAQIPQVGIIEMPREQVAADPDTACSYGLHAGTWNYASSFGRGKVIEVEIEPEDIVSIPIDSNSQKMRCCKYNVLGRVYVD